MNEDPQATAAPTEPAEIPDPPAAEAGAGDSAASGTDDAAERLQRERDELYDRLLRVTAEFDNYRKRIERERREIYERAAAAVLEDLLPIVDDLDRALGAEAGPEAETYRKGVEIIHRQLQELLTRRGVTPVPSVGTAFDPHLHQAVAYEPTPGKEDGEVVEELRRGYRIGDRLLRPAMVKVAKA